jgi:hypothetical protein
VKHESMNQLLLVLASAASRSSTISFLNAANGQG